MCDSCSLFVRNVRCTVNYDAHCCALLFLRCAQCERCKPTEGRRHNLGLVGVREWGGVVNRNVEYVRH